MATPKSPKTPISTASPSKPQPTRTTQQQAPTTFKSKVIQEKYNAMVLASYKKYRAANPGGNTANFVYHYNKNHVGKITAPSLEKVLKTKYLESKAKKGTPSDLSSTKATGKISVY